MKKKKKQLLVFFISWINYKQCRRICIMSPCQTASAVVNHFWPLANVFPQRANKPRRVKNRPNINFRFLVFFQPWVTEQNGIQSLKSD